MEEYSGAVGAPELEALAGMSIQLTHRHIMINAPGVFADMELSQLKGTILALDWVVGTSHRIWGSAVMVAPGVALTARHVFEDMLAAGLALGTKGYLLALGFHDDEMDIWNVDSLTNFHNGSDLAVLTLVRATAGGVDVSRPIAVDTASIAARQPDLGEVISVVGFVATETEFNNLGAGNAAGISLKGGVGPVNDLYPERCSARVPNPAFSVLAKTVNGMSGGGAFDADGRLIGVISSGIGEDITIVSQVWPCVFTPLKVSWPPKLVESPVTLHRMSLDGLCRIEGLEAVQAHEDADGGPRVSLFTRA